MRLGNFRFVRITFPPLARYTSSFQPSVDGALALLRPSNRPLQSVLDAVGIFCLVDGHCGNR